MKRFFPILFIAAFMIGVFAPLSVSLGTPNAPTTASVGIERAYAADYTVVTDNNQSKEDSKYDFYGEEIKCNLITHFGGCIAVLFYFIPYYVGGKLMLLSAWVFDSLAATTLSSKVYTGSEFIQAGWTVTRDFANIFLILILLFTALSFVLGIEPGHTNPKKMLVSVVIIAITINFSMFITEVVIDTSNSLALVFYNQIAVRVKNPAGTEEGGVVALSGQIPPKPISTALVEAFQPQVLQSKPFWDALRGENGGKYKTDQSNLTKEEIEKQKSDLHLAATGVWTAVMGPGAGLGYYFFGEEQATISTPKLVLILLLVGALYFVVAWSFLIASLSFFGRLAGLWISIIFAPLAFASYVVPSLHGIKGVGWSQWWSSLFEMAFAAPIYFFFLLLISLMSKSAMITRGFENQSAWTVLIIVILSMLLLIVLLIKATGYVKKASGELGEMAVKLGTAAVAGVGGLALGAATGALAFGARNTVGFVGKGIAENEERKKLAAGMVTDKWREKNLWAKDLSDDEIKKHSSFKGDQRRAKRMVGIGRGLASSSFDLRQNGVANMISEKTGMNMGSFGAFSAKNSAGGYDAATQRKAKKNKDFADSLGYSHAEQVELAQSVENREVEIAETEQKLAALRVNLKTNNDTNPNTVTDPLDPLYAGSKADVAKRLGDQIAALTSEMGRMKGNVNVDKWTEKEIHEQIALGTYSLVTKKPLTLSDIGRVKDPADLTVRPGETKSRAYNSADVGVAVRADGKKVTEQDVGKTTRTEFVGLGGLKKAQEIQMKSLGNSFQHYMMLNSGYTVAGMKTDALGNIKQLGHYHDIGASNKELARSWGRDMRRLIGGAAMGAAIGTGFAPGVGTIVGAIVGLGKQMYHNIDQHNAGTGPRGQAAASAALAGDSHAHFSDAKSTYKSPSSKIFDMFKELFAGGGDDHGGGHGHGDGGHSQGGGGHH